MQVFFGPRENFLAAGVIAVTPRRAPVERRDVQVSLTESAFVAFRATAEAARRVRAARPFGRGAREIVKPRRAPGKDLREMVRTN